VQREERLSDEEIWSIYEVERTAREIWEGGWRRIALQFPDQMLGDAVRVFEGLERDLGRLSAELPSSAGRIQGVKEGEGLEEDFTKLSTSDVSAHDKTRDGKEKRTENIGLEGERRRLYILADTSYGACCVDEIAAEHVDAEVVVHYGRSCLSPTARLPVIYVFTSRPLDIDDVVAAFEETYLRPGAQAEGNGKEEKVVLMADIMYHSHIGSILKVLHERGWRNILAPEVVHEPSSLIPNRKIELGEEELKENSIFHISDPPPALLLTLSSRVKDLHIYPTSNLATPPKSTTKTIQSNTTLSLRRRYALLTSLSTCPIFGILINTLSVKNYLPTISTIKSQIAAAGKKSYTFVVGKVNAAKIANFSEIGGWVVVGCWESSLIESTEFYRPIITPFELGLCLMGDGERVWTGGWRGDFEGLREVAAVEHKAGEVRGGTNGMNAEEHTNEGNALDGGELDSEEESEPPEFDLRTGRYVSHSRPMRATPTVSTRNPSSDLSSNPQEATSKVLARKAKLDLATVNGAVSPGAEYLRSQRTWTGLGSDFHDEEASESIEEGRRGVARGYTVGENSERT
jgi:diphthamide biosynthesis protein 2